MGYNAYTVDRDFTVPADKAADALAALNASLTDDPESSGGYTSLADAVDDQGGFEGSDNPGDNVNFDGFSLGWHHDKYHDDYVVAVLAPLAPFAKEGSYVRFSGEDDALWGFRVVDGKLEEEWGDYTWQLAKDRRAANRAVIEQLAGKPARISKTTITFTVLHTTDEPLSDDLARVLEEADIGNAVGQETARITEPVADSAVTAELVALGSDGEFFKEESAEDYEAWPGNRDL